VPISKCFIAGSYTWIPIHYLRRLEIEPPANLRDLVWARARVDTSADFRLQELGEVLLPVLCPLSSRMRMNPSSWAASRPGSRTKPMANPVRRQDDGSSTTSKFRCLRLRSVVVRP
jgi:hypothetical protein